jgi:hypothetical protein
MLSYQRGDRAGGERLLREAARIYPLEPGVYSDLGNRLEEDRRYAESARALAAAYRLDSRRSVLAARAIDNWVRDSSLDSATLLLNESWARDSAAVPLRIAKSDLALAAGRPEEALALRQAVAREAGRVWQYWYLAAEAGVEAGACVDAARAIARVRELKPGLAEVDSLDRRLRAARCPAS